MRVTLVGVATTVVLAGCGSGSAQVDRGGFTASDRKVAQAVLDTLRQTNIPTTLAVLTTAAATAPAVCKMHLVSAKPRTFKLFIFWIPSSLSPGATYTWLEATIGQQVLQDTFHIGHSDANAPKAQVLKSHSGDAFSKPVEECQLLINGYLRLLADK
jgi:hypothetical protein